MEENSVNKLLEIQTLIINIVKDNQIQITDLKSYLDKDNPKFYKDIILPLMIRKKFFKRSNWK